MNPFYCLRQASDWAWHEAPVTNPNELVVLLLATAGEHSLAELARMARLETPEVLEILADLTGRGLIEFMDEEEDAFGFFLATSGRLHFGITALLDRHEKQARARRATSGPKRWRIIALVVARDGALCGLCGQPVDLDHVEVEHDLPVSLDGNSELDNLQLAHGDCNLRKGSRLAERVLPPLRSGIARAAAG